MDDDRLQHTVALLRDVVHIVQERIRPLLAQEGIGLTHLAVLRHVAQNGPCSHASVSTAMGMTPGSLTPLLHQLEEKGWVVRRPDATDRRRVLVELHPRALGRAKRLRRQAPALLGDLFEGISDEEMEAFTSVLERIRARGARKGRETA